MTDRIVVTQDTCCGKPRVRGTRLTVELIVGLTRAGWSNETILRNYPHLTEADIAACLNYMFQQEDVRP